MLTVRAARTRSTLEAGRRALVLAPAIPRLASARQVPGARFGRRRARGGSPAKRRRASPFR